jgi:hypothetical protein
MQARAFIAEPVDGRDNDVVEVVTATSGRHLQP